MQQEKSPYDPSYPQSAIRFKGYRIFLVAFSIGIIMIGKQGLPTDKVQCIEDVVLNALQPITDVYLQYPIIGLFFFTLLQLIVDAQLIGGMLWWLLRGTSFKYPLTLTIFGLTKIILNVMFQTRPIAHSFTTQFLPSLVFGANFANTYFFSGVIGLLTINLCMLKEQRKYFYMQLMVIIYATIILLTMRQNFIMDIVTAPVFAYYTFTIIEQHSEHIDALTLNINQTLFDKKDREY